MVRRFLSNCDGAVTLIASLMLMTLVLATGGAVDYSNAMNKRQQLQKIADSSVLAAASRSNETDPRASAEKMIIHSAFCKANTCTPLIIEKTSDVSVSIEAKVKTTLLQLVGVKTVPVSVFASAAAPVAGNVDVVMMLDFSGSMAWSNKYKDMIAAAQVFLSDLSDAGSNGARVGIVPFSKFVLTQMNGRFLYDVVEEKILDDAIAIGCILNRSHPFSIGVETPVPTEIGSLWPVLSYSYGSNPHAGYSEEYRVGEAVGDDKTVDYTFQGSTYTFRYRDHAPHSGKSDPVFTEYLGSDTYVHNGTTHSNVLEIEGHDELEIVTVGASSPKLKCANCIPWGSNPKPVHTYANATSWKTVSDNGLHPDFEKHAADELNPFCAQYVERKLWTRPLTHDLKAISDRVALMQPAGATNIALAMDVGWHILSDNEPFTETASTPSQRFAILLTDGVQTVRAHGEDNDYSRSAANDNIIETCAGMKADNITVFTIAFGISNDYTRTILQDCASTGAHFYEPSKGDELKGVFKGILKSLSSGSVRITG